MENKLKISSGLTGFSLKIIGIVLMVCDHLHQMFYVQGAPIWLTMVGRVVAPIFLFLSAESFQYTRSKKTYLFRLLCGFWLMSLASSLLQQLAPNPDVMLLNSMFGTLFLAVYYMWVVDLVESGLEKRTVKPVFLGLLAGLIPIGASALLIESINIHITLFRILMMALPTFFNVEGGWGWVLLGVGFYICRNHRLAQIGLLVFLSAFSFALSGGHQWLMVFAAIPIFFYNGKPGKKSKWFFYIFYPVHIYILYLISYFLQR